MIRHRVKSLAGERVLALPPWCLEMLRARWSEDLEPTSPIFPNSTGGFRDPHNVQKAIRSPRRPVGSERQQELGAALKRLRRAAGLTQQQAVQGLGWRRTRISLIETARVALSRTEAIALADLYKVSGRDRAALLELTEIGGPQLVGGRACVGHRAHVQEEHRHGSRGLRPNRTTDRRPARTRLHQHHHEALCRAEVAQPEAADYLEVAFGGIHAQQRQTTQEPEL